MKLNDEKFDELMFQLLEGEITGEERERLLDAIQADEHYSKQWQAWQKTVLDPSDEMTVMNTSKLLKKDNRRTLIVWWKYAAAAVVVLTVALAVYKMNSTSDPSQPVMVGQDEPNSNKTRVITVPNLAPVTPVKRERDTTPTLKQKVRMMVDKPYVPKSPVEPVFQKTPEEQPEIVRQPEKGELKEMPRQQEGDMDHGKELIPVQPVVANNTSGVIMTVYSETENKPVLASIGTRIEEKRNLLSRVFSAPKIKIVNDSKTYTNKKIIVENKAYKIIAGF